MEQTKTPKAAEVERMLAENRICDAYQMAMRAGQKAPTAIMMDIAHDEGYSLEGVRKVLIRNMAYTPKERKEEEA